MKQPKSTQGSWVRSVKARPFASSHSWRQQAANAITDPAELLQRLSLPPSLLPAARQAARLFPLRVPLSFLQRMSKGDPDDPLLRQVLPLDLELDSPIGYSSDPVGDRQAMPYAGVLHKYHGRTLLVATGACALHCRYCFRRHFPYGSANPGRDQWRGTIDYIASNPTIEEVILSGGDPLSLSERRLAALCRELEPIPHVRRLRIHTRLPVVIPARIDRSLLSWLDTLSKPLVFVLHVNHANELDDEVYAAMERLRHDKLMVFNQAVLLRGVNDNVESLAALSEALFAAGIVPYYLHLLDRVAGAAHFEVEQTRARDVYRQLLERLPGYLVPRLVRETPGAASKTPVI